MSGRTNDKLTRDVDEYRDLNNYKPYRSKAGKIAARNNAYKCSDGAYRSSEPTLRHKVNIALKGKGNVDF